MSLLKLTRRVGERVFIGGEEGRIIVTIEEVRGYQVKLAIEAPPNVGIDREEVAVRRAQGEFDFYPTKDI